LNIKDVPTNPKSVCVWRICIRVSCGGGQNKRIIMPNARGGHDCFRRTRQGHRKNKFAWAENKRLKVPLTDLL
jgi:hypothetical protein